MAMQDGLSIFITAAPLLALTFGVIKYTVDKASAEKRQKLEDYVSMIDRFGANNSSFAGNLATAFILRDYPEFEEASIRVFREIEKTNPDDAAVSIMRESLVELKKRRT